jgi:uridine kinase
MMLTDVAQRLLETAVSRAPIIAVDGRSASGKTTVARRLADAIPGACVVHTDDLAWWHSFFTWTDLLIHGVLEPWSAGRAVSYRPPAWNERRRAGAIEVPVDATALLIEGVGAGRREVAHLLDAVVYVQADMQERAAREQARYAAREVDPEVSDAWLREEVGFMAEQRPWERADVIVGSTTGVAHDRDRELVVADGPLATPP